MLRFFFDVLEDGEVTPDDGGLECDCRDAAEYGPLGARPRSGVCGPSQQEGRWRSGPLCGRSHDGSPLGTCAGLKRLCRERP
jgi:hypothetical protein